MARQERFPPVHSAIQDKTRGADLFARGERQRQEHFAGPAGRRTAPQPCRLRVLDTDLMALTPSARDRFRVEHIGFLFQQFNLVPYLSVRENVLLPCRFSRRRRSQAAGCDPQVPTRVSMRLMSSNNRQTGYSISWGWIPGWRNNPPRLFLLDSSNAWQPPAPHRTS